MQIISEYDEKCNKSCWHNTGCIQHHVIWRQGKEIYHTMKTPDSPVCLSHGLVSDWEKEVRPYRKEHK